MKQYLPSPTVKKVRRQFWRFLLSRLTITAVLILIQIIALAVFLTNLSGRLRYLLPVSQALGIIVVIWLVRKTDNPSYKIPWIILILSLPIVGLVFFFVLGKYTTQSRSFGRNSAA